MANSLSELLDEFTRKVLIIDDDPDIITLVSSIVKKMDGAKKTVIFECLSATNGTEGLELFERDHPDLVILDIAMKDISGIQVLEKIKHQDDKKLSQIPVLMLTVKRDSETVIKSMRTGANGYLVKPFKKDDLIARIQKLLQV